MNLSTSDIALLAIAVILGIALIAGWGSAVLH